MKRTFTILILFILLASQGSCWIFPEHRDIMMLAIYRLDPARKAALERYWKQFRVGYETRLSLLPADSTLKKDPTLIDYAAFPAFAGDHSTSSADLTASILNADWVFKVSDVAWTLKVGLEKARNRSDRLNKLRDSDLRLLKADPYYVSRAGANNVHFMLARPEVGTEMVPYLQACATPGAELSAPGAYWWYHLSALQKASAYAADTAGPHARDYLMAALADEGFALHFLEDMFASGHVAGTWGNASQRKGTHDYYDERGIEVSTWTGKRLVLMGDAFMRPEDADLASVTVSLSLSQVIDAAGGKIAVHYPPDQIVPAAPDTFNVCRETEISDRYHDPSNVPYFRDVLEETVMPGLAKGAGELPRFRAEIGPFVGLSAAARGSVVFNGFGQDQHTAGWISGVDMSVRLGLGLEGVLNEAGDGMVFLDLGYRLDGASSMKITPNEELKQYGNYSSAIPYRNSLYARLRLPFYIVPGDLLVLAPLLYFVAPNAMSNVVATSGNGGVIPWQSGILTSIGRFQFVLGREVGVYLFGMNKTHDQFILPVEVNGEQKQAVVNMRSTQLEFPVAEYRPFRHYSSSQTAGLMIQLFGGVDIPGKASVVVPEGIAVPPTKAIPIAGLRVVFDWRYYLGGHKD